MLAFQTDSMEIADSEAQLLTRRLKSLRKTVATNPAPFVNPAALPDEQAIPCKKLVNSVKPQVYMRNQKPGKSHTF